MAPVVNVDGLSKNFGEVTALRDVSVSITSGEIFGLIGPNGAGKTTFVRSITGTIRPSGGDVSVFDRDPRTIDHARIGLLPQAFRPPERLTGREIISYYAGLYDESRDVEGVLADIGMENDADRWYERLSGGQQRRICVGTALVNDPDLLVLDEPTTGIDPGGRRMLWELFRGLQEAGRTILLTTHDMNEAAALADRVGLIARGQLIEVGTPPALIANHGGSGRIVVEPSDQLPTNLEDIVGRPLTIHESSVVIDPVESDAVGSVIRTLDEAEVPYRRIAWEEPTLEDVFFALTGKEANV